MSNTRLDAILTFLDGIRKNPRHTGAIFPSGPVLAREMASFVDPSIAGTVIELGPGTGIFTEALLKRGVAPENLVLIEYNADFCSFLRNRFPNVRVIEGSAFEIEKICQQEGIAQVSSIVSGLPLLNFPMDMRVDLVEAAFRLMDPRAKYVQFTYGAKPSVPQRLVSGKVTPGKRIWRNFPPATVWVYEAVAAEARTAQAA